MLFSRRALLLHAILAVVVPAFSLLCAWQVRRALSGNELSWAYVFEWPLFAGYAVYLWWRLVREIGVEGDERAAVGATSSLVGTAGDPSAPANTGAEPAAAGVLGAATGGPAVADVGAAVHTPEPLPSGASEAGGDVAEDTDEDLAAYNRYLAELNAGNVPKRWGARR